MNEIIHNLFVHLQSPEGILDIFKIIIPTGALIYAIKKFSLNYRKPKFNIIAIQTEIHEFSKVNYHCHLAIEVFNRASFENTAYIEVMTLYHKTINPFFFPKEERPHVVIPANSHAVKYFTIYIPCSAAYINKWLIVRLTDAKGKKSSKYIKWKTTAT